LQRQQLKEMNIINSLKLSGWPTKAFVLGNQFKVLLLHQNKQPSTVTVAPQIIISGTLLGSTLAKFSHANSLTARKLSLKFTFGVSICIFPSVLFVVLAFIHCLVWELSHSRFAEEIARILLPDATYFHSSLIHISISKQNVDLIRL